jgi:hypothetical protein
MFVYLTKDLYNKFKEFNPKSTIDYKTYSNVSQDFHDLISQEITNGHIFATVIGKFECLRYERQGKHLDYVATKKYKLELIEEKKQIFDAEHPDGIDYRIYYTTEEIVKWSWNSANSLVKHIRNYAFEECRANKHLLGKVYNSSATAKLKFKKIYRKTKF